jgi:two-component system, chemotaxis family, protein-glutamate methylesterase/glutaminase
MMRVVIVDDSEIVCRRLEEILEAAKDLRVIRKLSSLNGVDVARELSGADVVLVDMFMPGRSGLAALKELASHAPVVVVSDADADSDVAREAVARGARAWIGKYELANPSGHERLRQVVRGAAAQRVSETPAPVLVLVGSTGAHRALERLVPAVAPQSWRVIVLQHLPEKGDEAFAQWLCALGMPAQLATSGQVLGSTRALVAPSGLQMRIDKSGRVRLSRPAGELYTPSADILLESASVLGSLLTTVILSGLGRDGSTGAACVVRAGGRVLVQAPAECVASSMPTYALEAARSARSVSVDALVKELGSAKWR